MATGPPPTTNGPTNPDVGPQTAPADLNWEGDRMFNIYIIDYCQKRGFLKTAQQLAEEADIPLESQPPINAKQGLLFEWWSVFWVLFTAKSNGTGSEDAMAYTQHQAQLRSQQKPINTIPPVRPANRGPGQVPMLANGPSAGPPLPGQPQMPNGAPTQHPYGAQPHVNGATPQANGPAIGTPGGPNVSRAGPPQQQPQRTVNGTMQRSPTMAPSPQTQGGPQQPGSMPTMRMMPPNGPQARPGNGMPGAPHQTPQPVYQQIPGATPSHPNSPAQQPGTTAGPSPSFSVPQPQIDVNAEFWNIDTSKLNELKQDLGLSQKDVPSLTIQDKARMFQMAKQRGWLKGPQGGHPNPAAGPSNPLARPPQQLQTPQTQPRSVKRSSTSPGNEPQNSDTSPPANKRLRRSPTGTEGPPPMAPMIPSYPQQQQPGTPAAQHHGIPNGAMNRAMAMTMPTMGGFPGGMQHMGGNPQMMQMNPQIQPGGPHMSPALVNQHPPGNMAMAQFQYRQNMQAVHKSGAMPSLMPGAQGPPAASDGQFGGGDVQGGRPGTGQFVQPGMQMQPGMQGQMAPGMPGQRITIQNKPGVMMPPPSPAAINKNNVAQMKDEPSVHSSPRNTVMTGPGPQGPPPAPGSTPHMGGGTAPPTPAPAAATPGAGPSNMTVPSPPVMNGAPQQPQQNDGLGTEAMFPSNLFGELTFGGDLPNFDFENFPTDFDLGGPTAWTS